MRIAGVIGLSLVLAGILTPKTATSEPAIQADPPEPRPDQPDLPPGYERTALITEVGVAVFDTYRADRRAIGHVQRGITLPVRPVRSASNANLACFAHDLAGTWHQTPGGFICSSGFATMRSARDLKPPAAHPNLSSALPYRYVKSKAANTPRYRRVPKYGRPSLVENMSKAYFLAYAGKQTVQGIEYVRTAYGEYARAEDIKPVVPTTLTGARLEGATRLPLVFVVPPKDEDASPVFCEQNAQTPTRCGSAPRYARFFMKAFFATATQEFVQIDDRRLLPRSRVRIVQRVPRPAEIPDHAKWVHFDLDAQTFVAYEGDRPVYASLVSTGVKGRDTPTGLYRTERKYILKTMTGPDEDHGSYRVEEIPWVMYYHDKYAVHGAYWHNTFGNVRSHGCTNIAPTDAKWLFDWGPGRIHERWISNLNVKDGLYFWFTQRKEL